MDSKDNSSFSVGVSKISENKDQRKFQLMTKVTRSYYRRMGLLLSLFLLRLPFGFGQ